MGSVTRWSDMKTVPQNYIFPPELRSGDYIVPPSNEVPVIDMATGCDSFLRQIMQASEDLGVFQVINHGIEKRLMDEARGLLKEFFELPAEEISKFGLGKADPRFIFSISNIDHDKEELHFWRECFYQKCSPLAECVPVWPEKPTRYREVIADYVTKVYELGSRLLELLCQGLGLEPHFFENESREDVQLIVNHYPPSPNPSLTIGVQKHSDRGLITILMQDHVPGLQAFKDGEWFAVEPISDALVVIIGYSLHMLSNGKLKNGDHRAVSNAKEARLSAALFISPALNCRIEPATALVNKKFPPIYRPVFYHEFKQLYNAARQDKKDPEEVLNHFRVADTFASASKEY